MTYKEDTILADASATTPQPRSVELSSALPEAPAGDVLRIIQYMDNETFRRSLQKVASRHARLLEKLAE